jgi:hypothetical protein
VGGLSGEQPGQLAALGVAWWGRPAGGCDLRGGGFPLLLWDGVVVRDV